MNNITYERKLNVSDLKIFIVSSQPAPLVHQLSTSRKIQSSSIQQRWRSCALYSNVPGSIVVGGLQRFVCAKLKVPSSAGVFCWGLLSPILLIYITIFRVGPTHQRDQQRFIAYNFNHLPVFSTKTPGLVNNCILRNYYYISM